MASERKSICVSFQPEGRRVRVAEGATAYEAALKAGIHLDTPCGGKGICGKCKVRFLEGAPPPTEADRKFLSPEELSEGLRLACQARILSPAVIAIPSNTLPFVRRILDRTLGARVKPQPCVSKKVLQLPPATVHDERADWERATKRLGRGLKPASLQALAQLPQALRKANFLTTAVRFDDGSLCFEAGDTSGRLFGVAFDIGTTTLVGSLCDLLTGSQLASSVKPNPQMAFGDDVISRLTHALEGRGSQLQETIVSALNEMLLELCRQAGVKGEEVYEIVVSGNTAMGHLLLGLDVEQLARAPYVPAVSSSVYVPAREIGLKAHPEARLYVLPVIGSFVGGDTVSLILATRIHRSPKLRMALDLGTNGEVVIGSCDGVFACSTAAGPAFEGARISQGMRAMEGAIERVELSGSDVRIGVIGGGKARGICGSGLVDAVATLLQAGVLDEMGSLPSPEEAKSFLPPPLASRLREGDEGKEFVLAWPEESENAKGISLTQRDIREVQLAKGAIRTGAELLMRHLGVKPSDIEEVFIAGAFGNYLRPESALRIGLLPPLSPEKVKFVGNTSILGARLCLLSRRKRREAERIARKVHHVELAAEPSFEETFVEMMSFPREGEQ